MEGPVYQKTIDFSVRLIGLYKELIQNKEFIISRQLLRSGTSIGANVHEAGSAQSRKDFISKMSIALKEARETKYWLIVLAGGKLINFDLTNLLDDVEELIKIISKIVISSKHNLTTK